MTDTLTLDAQIEQLRAHRDRLASGQVRAHDPRLAAFWERAGEKASDEGMCGVYDDIVDEVGGVSREHDYDIDVSVTVTVSTTLRRTARDWESARDAIHDMDSDDVFAEMLERLGVDSDITDHADAEAVSIGEVTRADY